MWIDASHTNAVYRTVMKDNLAFHDDNDVNAWNASTNLPTAKSPHVSYT